MYTSRISSVHPMLIMLLIDQSGSMAEKTRFRDMELSKAEALSLCVNMLLTELLYRCSREEGYRNYFEVGVLGYRGQEVVSLLGSAQSPIVPITSLPTRELRRERMQKERTMPDGRTLLSVVEQRIWIEPHAEGQTPMYAALNQALGVVRRWCNRKEHRHCYPPIVFNITDGESSDGDALRLQEVATKIKGVSTEDGEVLLVNVHLSSDATAEPVLFAASEEELPEQRYARLLYQMSSMLPSNYEEGAASLRGSRAESYRAMSYNTAMNDLIGMLNIGSVSVTLFD